MTKPAFILLLGVALILHPLAASANDGEWLKRAVAKARNSRDRRARGRL